MKSASWLHVPAGFQIPFPIKTPVVVESLPFFQTFSTKINSSGNFLPLFHNDTVKLEVSHISFSPVSVCCIILLEPLTMTHRVFAPSLLTYTYPNYYYYCYPYALPFFIAHNIAPLSHKKSPCKEFVFATLSLPCEGLGPPPFFGYSSRCLKSNIACNP